MKNWDVKRYNQIQYSWYFHAISFAVEYFDSMYIIYGLYIYGILLTEILILISKHFRVKQWGVINRLCHNGDIIMGAMASQITSLTFVYSTVYPCADQRKYQSSASVAFVRGTHWWAVNSPHKSPVTRKMFPFDDVIMPSLNVGLVRFSWKLSHWGWVTSSHIKHGCNYLPMPGSQLNHVSKGGLVIS